MYCTALSKSLEKAVAGPNLQIKGRGRGGLKNFFSLPSDLSLGEGEVARGHCRTAPEKLLVSIGESRGRNWALRGKCPASPVENKQPLQVNELRI